MKTKNMQITLIVPEEEYKELDKKIQELVVNVKGEVTGIHISEGPVKGVGLTLRDAQ